MARKEYEELTFTDDFMFCKVLSTHKDLCIELLELILDVKIRDVKPIEEQKEINHTYDGKGIRLDVYVEDDNDSVYDIEMQSVVKPELPKRARYYQGMMDLNMTDKGADYTRLKKSFVIFICLNDPFDRGLAVYTFANRCKEDSTLELGDEAYKFFLNAKGKRDDLSDEMVEFLDYLIDNIPRGRFTRKLQDKVEDAILHKEWRWDYMTFGLALQDERVEGRKEGREEGRILALISLVCKKLEKGKDVTSIADDLEETIDLIEKICAAANDPANGKDVEKIYEALYGQ